MGIVAQRLVRKVCTECAREVVMTPEQMAVLDIELPPGRDRLLKIKEGDGCVKCRGTGLYGRVAIFEMLVVNETIRRLINDRADATEIMRAARAGG